MKAALEKDSVDKKEKEVENKKKKENQMSEWEVNKAYAVSLKNKLLELEKTSGKKVVLSLEMIQTFALINMSNYPSKKTDISPCIEKVNA